jgi:hypothetical protein
VSYHIHIERSAARGVVTADELDALQSDHFRVTRAPGSTKGSLVYSLTLGDSEMNFFLSDGEVWAERLNESDLSMFSRLADELGGVLVGDEGERYLPEGLAVEAPKEEHAGRQSRKAPRNWIRTVLFVGILYLVFTAVAMLIGRL